MRKVNQLMQTMFILLVSLFGLAACGGGSSSDGSATPQNPTYSLSYDDNGSDSGSVPVDTTDYQAGQTVTVAGNPGSLTKAGYTFVGWNTAAAGTGNTYTQSQTFAMGSANITLYALWNANPTYSLSYDGNGSDSGSAPVDATDYQAGQTVTVAGNPGSLTRAGYTFVGWNTAAAGTGTTYTQSQTFAMGASDVTLYAQWSSNPTYRLIYDGNGYTGGNVPSDTTRYEQGQTVTVTGNTALLVKAGYSFSGWNTQADGSGTGYAQAQTLVMGAADLTLYAQWNPNPTYHVSYDGNGSSGGSAPLDSNSYEAGQTVTVLGNSGNFSNTGYSFAGWNTRADGSGTGYTQSQTFSMGSADVTLYAQWSANPTFTLTYDGNGNTGGSVPLDSTHYEQGQTVTVAGNTSVLVKDGYSFSGWNTQSDGSGTGYAPNASFIMGAADVTLYAQWNANPTYSLTYDGNGSTGGSAPVDSNHYEAGQTVTVLGNTGNLTKTGYSFVGWNTQADGNGSGYTQSQTFSMGSANVTLYAQWSANPTYSLTYDGNGNDSGSVPVDSTRYVQGQMVTVLGNVSGLAKDGYSLSGWNTQADGLGDSYSPSGSFAMGDADTVLYAQWTLNPTYSLSYDGNGSTGGSAPLDSNSYEQGQLVSVLGNTGNLTNAGYTFSGWNTQSDGSGTTYTQSQTFAMGSANVVLYAQWSLNPTYSLTYDGNGNTSGSVPVDSTQYEAGQTVTVMGNSAVLAKTGSSFAGWNTQSDGNGTAYAPNASFTMGTADVILYAQWTLNPTYHVNYDGNGNTGGSVPVDSTEYESGDAAIVYGNVSGLTKTGYSFSGWNTQANGTGTGYGQGDTLVIGSVSPTLYAQWSANPTYSVTYNGNGNDSGNVPVDAIGYEAGQTVTVAGNPGALVRAGYTFVGWNTAASGAGTTYTQSQTFSMGSANVNLYALWSLNPTYSLTYDGNGNTGGSVPIDATRYEQGQTVTVAGNTSSLVKAGYSFTGWNTQSDGSGTGYAPNASFSMGAANLTLYAQWNPNPTYSVSYSGNGSTGGTAPIDSNNYEAGQTVTLLGNTGNLTRTGYSFAGWNTQSNGTGTGYTQSQTFTMGSASVMLYAQWTLNPTYTLTYDGNGNTGGSVPVDSTHYEQGQTVSVAGNTSLLVKSGYSFSGWNTQPDSSGTGYAPNDTFAMGSANVTLYAQWNPNPTYSVSYDGNGSTGGSAPVDSNSYEAGQVVTVLGNTGNFTRTGYSFAGWNTLANGSGTGYTQSQTFSMGSADVILYAQWTLNPTYSVTYNGNGNTSGSVPVDSTQYEQGQTVTVLGNTSVLIRTGYSFTGWNTQSNGGGTGYTQSQTFSMGTTDVTLYAQWNLNPTYSVTYNGNGSTGGSAPVDSNHYEQGQTVTVLGNTGNFTNVGYSFSGWNTQSDGNGSGYTQSQTFSMGGANVILYAQWTLNPTYGVTYNGNGNTGGSVPVDSTQYESGTTVTVLGNTSVLTKTGFNFSGWNTQANGSGVGYNPGGTFAMGTSNLTLYAQWSAPLPNMLYNAGTSTGNLGGVSGADARCQSYKPTACGSSRTKVAAFLSPTRTDPFNNILDIPARIGISGDAAVVGPTGIQISANWAALEGDIDVTLAAAGILPANQYWWSGTVISGGTMLSSSGCDDGTNTWVNSAGGTWDTGFAGWSSATAAKDWMSLETGTRPWSCNHSYYVLCVCGE